MSKNAIRLSNRELDVMNILWDSEKALVASEITQVNPSLSINTVQAVLKNLLRKAYIKIADIVYSGTVLTRAYETVLTREDYVATQLQDNKLLTPGIFAALVEQESNENIIEELEGILQARKQRIKGTE